MFLSKKSKLTLLLVIYFLVIFIACDNSKQEKIELNYIEHLSESIEGKVVSIQDLPAPLTIPLPPFIERKNSIPDTISFKRNKKFTLKPKQKSLLDAPQVFSLRDPDVGKPRVYSFVKQKLIANIPETVVAKDGIMKVENPFSFISFTRNQGLAHDDISSITYDDKGAMWLGTYGAGIVRFDGKHFSNFNVENGLTDNFVLDVLFDTHGRLLIGTRSDGLLVYDGTDFLKIETDSLLPNLRIEKIFQDSSGNIWLGTFGNGAFKLTDSTLINYRFGYGLNAQTVYDIAEDKKGKIWFATRENGISSFDGESFTQYQTEHGLPENYIITIDVDLNGDLWIGTNSKGVAVFDGTTFSYYNEKSGFPENDITTIYAGNNGDIFLGTRYAGIVRYDGIDFTQYSYDEGLINTFITVIREDVSGKIWFGTYGGGLSTYQGDLFKHYNESTGIPEAFIRTIFQDSEGNKWFGTNESGAFIMRPEYLLHFNKKHGLADNRLRTIYEDSDNRIWFGLLYGGVSVYDERKMLSFPVESVLSEIAVLSILQSDNQVIWLGSYGDGLFKIEGDSVTQFTTENGLSDNYIRKIVEDHSGNIWIATRSGGINMFDGESFTHYTKSQGLPVNDIFDIVVDADNNIWVGTNGFGILAIVDRTKVFSFTERQDLGSNYVYSILEDHEENLWFGTRWGLSQLIDKQNLISHDPNHDPKSDRAHQTGKFFKNFSYNDGFMGIGVNSRAMYQDNDNDNVIWIGSNDIITSVNISNIYADNMKPKVSLNWVGLFNEFVNWSDLVSRQDTNIRLRSGVIINNFSLDSVTPWNNIPVNLSLPHNNNYLVFNFSAINPDLSTNIQYQYYLEGLDHSWSPLTKRSEVHYGNLSPGKYRFVLRSINNEGIFSDATSFSFKITYPWWQTWWALLLYFTIVTGIWYAYKRFRDVQQQIREKRKQEELQLQQEVEIARKSAEFKQSFLANMSHEIRTPLTGILGMAELMQNTKLDPVQEDYLKTLILSGENLKETINMVLDYSKIEAGKVKVNKSVFPFSLLFENALKLFFSLNRKKLTIEKYIAPEVPLYVKTDYNRIFQILSNLISNAVKFTEKGKISLFASIEQPVDSNENLLLKITVADTGQGIPDDKKHGLFKPFYQVEQAYNRSYEGTGLGLAICKELALILGGDIGVESQLGKGSDFWFTFKVEEAANLQSNGKPELENKPNTHVALRVLLVEDKPINQKVVSLMLNSLNHQVVIADNGKKAIEMFKPGAFDLILMDIQMPVMDGISATNILRESYSNLPPIVGLSANAFDGDREKYMARGLNEYLTKPVKQKDFLDIVKKLNLDT
jgi:signal transduction histidine kinase/ligand-binding sensor domain-containing protein/CheY-like chemotaxis protein